jgi:2'-5' RNA ligase
MRLFLGIPLAAPVITELSALSVQIHSPDDGLRWSAPDTWHITLQFLGNTSQDQYACIVARLHELRSTLISIQLESLGFFERAGIFFVGVRPTSELIRLQQKVTATTAHCGFISEAHPYHPHITLARNKGKKDMRELHWLKSRIPRQLNFTAFTAENFFLYESFTSPSGSHYDIRERFPFNNIGAE